MEDTANRLVFDLGNTAWKLALFEGDELRFTEYCFEANFESHLKESLPRLPEIKSAILSSVIDTPPSVIKLLRSNFNLHILSHESNLPFKNLYETPQTLGIDRMAAMAGTLMHFGHSNVLSIDAGTCIKYDYLNENFEYLGGAISPGIEMRCKAMNTFTDKLPLIKPDGQFKLIGKSTNECLNTGAVLGSYAEVYQMITYYKHYYPEVKVLISGGFYKYFDERKEDRIYVLPNIQLFGLKVILRINES